VEAQQKARFRISGAEFRVPVLKTGFNHRFHPAVRRSKEICDAGGIGTVLTIRARYGHGGRPGMENEWRSSKELCGGGELLDQGVHVIDLIRWFGGDIREVFGKVETKFWNIEVEDNAFAILKTDKDVTASFHVSWTNWRNVFSFEVFGTDGYIKIEGLGGSYGPETLEYGRRKKEGGRPDIELVEFPAEDTSWKLEWKEFKSAIHERREPIGSGLDGLRANEIIEALYRSNAEKRTVTV
jgi:predicted dehydrogenase